MKQKTFQEQPVPVGLPGESTGHSQLPNGAVSYYSDDPRQHQHHAYNYLDRESLPARKPSQQYGDDRVHVGIARDAARLVMPKQPNVSGKGDNRSAEHQVSHTENDGASTLPASKLRASPLSTDTTLSATPPSIIWMLAAIGFEAGSGSRCDQMVPTAQAIVPMSNASRGSSSILPET